VNLAGVLRARWPTALLIGVPLALVAAAFGWLAAEHDTWHLWHVTVHESGRYTLAQTVFFFRHFLREVPVDVAMGLFCAAAVAAAEPGARRRPSPAISATIALGLVMLAFAVASREEGARRAMQDLLQFRTRDDDSTYGAHWNFHLLSTVWFGSAALMAAAVWAGRGGAVRLVGTARTLHLVAWAWVALLTVVFGVQGEVFTSARYIGHQAREILTHGLITLPLTIGLLRWATDRGKTPDPGRQIAHVASGQRMLLWLAVAGIPVFLAVAFRRADLAATAQMHSGLAGVVAAHVFEHLLDIGLVVLVGLAAIAMERPAGRSGGR